MPTFVAPLSVWGALAAILVVNSFGLTSAELSRYATPAMFTAFAIAGAVYAERRVIQQTGAVIAILLCISHIVVIASIATS